MTDSDDRRDDLPLWQYIAAIGVPAIPFVIVFIRWSSLPNDRSPISFADSVEMINAFLGAAAFAAVVLTLLLQRKDLHEQSHQFQEAMRMQALGTYLSVIDCRRQMVSSRPIVPDDCDIKTLHLAVSLFQITNYLNRIELMLQHSATLTADTEEAALQQSVAQMRRTIARIATLDVTRQALKEPNATPASVQRLVDWLASVASDRELPVHIRAEVGSRCTAISEKLTSMLARQWHSQVSSVLAPFDADLDQLRILLVRAVRYSTIPKMPNGREAEVPPENRPSSDDGSCGT